MNQVNEMLMHCEHGLLQFHPEKDCRWLLILQVEILEKENVIILEKWIESHIVFFLLKYRVGKTETTPYKDLAVKAAAAAIYSTSNFLKSMENLPCFWSFLDVQ